MKRALVFGSTGMVGRAVVARLNGLADLDLVPISRQSHGFDARDAALRIPEILEAGAVIVNCIGRLRADPAYGTLSFQRDLTLVNSLWPQRLALAAADLGCRVIHLSTDAVFSPGCEAANESTPVSASEMYGLSKALGEVDALHVINIRFSAIGPAPDRPPSLWEWLVRQPRGAEVPGYDTFEWSGCTSAQIASFVSDLLVPATFEAVRTLGAACHFVPNGASTKFAVLKRIAQDLRPDLRVVPVNQEKPTSRLLITGSTLLSSMYSGPRGWSEALSQVIGDRC